MRTGACSTSGPYRRARTAPAPESRARRPFAACRVLRSIATGVTCGATVALTAVAARTLRHGRAASEHRPTAAATPRDRWADVTDGPT
jgi:hypothetical protein